MPNLSTILKSEITRLARKEIKAAVDPVRKANAGHRKEIAELKRQVASLQRDIKASSKPSKVRPEAGESMNGSTRFSPKGLKSLRARLGFSAAEFGVLVGASAQSLYNWEAGRAVPRASQRVALAGLRGIGKREAAKRLAAMG
jgi:DNA-binding transcriptional regulator YiaG